MEIERKWIVSGYPTGLKEVKSERIEQGYLTITPEVRLRSNKNSYSQEFTYELAIKGEGDLSRKEVEFPITKDIYDELTSLITKPMIIKEYKKYDLGDGLYLECSYVQTAYGLIFYYAEVEFDTEEQANNFILPLGVFNTKKTSPILSSALNPIEVTFDKAYKMKNIWSAYDEFNVLVE